MQQNAIETVKSATQTIHTLQLSYYKKELQPPWMGEHKFGYSIQKKNNLCLHGDNMCLCLEQTCAEKATRESQKPFPRATSSFQQTARDVGRHPPCQESICVHGSVSQKAALTFISPKNGRNQPLVTLIQTLHGMIFQELAFLLHALKTHSLFPSHTRLYLI